MTFLRRCGSSRLVVIALAALAGCGDAEVGVGRPSLQTAAARLPADAAGFVRGRSIDYERERAGYGIGVDYATPNRAAVATVSVYDRGRGFIGSDPASSEIESELATAVREASEGATGRGARRLAEAQRVTLPVDGTPGLRCARMEGTFGRAPVRRLVCIGGASGRYLRVQVTMPDRGAPADADAFAAAMLRAARGR